MLNVKHALLIVSPAVRVLSPAWAPRGLHRALFMNSVSHGKIWTENAASPLNKPVLLRRVCLSGISPKIHPSPPTLPPLSFQLPIKGYNLLSKRWAVWGGGGGGVTQNRSGRLYFVTGSPPPFHQPSHGFRYKLVLGQRGSFRV